MRADEPDLGNLSRAWCAKTLYPAGEIDAVALLKPVLAARSFVRFIMMATAEWHKKRIRWLPPCRGRNFAAMMRIYRTVACRRRLTTPRDQAAAGNHLRLVRLATPWPFGDRRFTEALWNQRRRPSCLGGLSRHGFLPTGEAH